jgi:hypothetical protein
VLAQQVQLLTEANLLAAGNIEGRAEKLGERVERSWAAGGFIGIRAETAFRALNIK